MTKPSSSVKEPSAPQKRTILNINSAPDYRPNWRDIVNRVIGAKNTTDVCVNSLSAFYAFRRTAMLLGFYVWRHQVGDNSWILRLSDNPTAINSSPLRREYGRGYSTSHGRWVRLADELMEGKTVSLEKRSDVTLMRVNLRKYYPPDKFPARTMRFKQEQEGVGPWIVWLEPA
jgi:hypothetical protein